MSLDYTEQQKRLDAMRINAPTETPPDTTPHWRTTSAAWLIVARRWLAVVLRFVAVRVDVETQAPPKQISNVIWQDAKPKAPPIQRWK